MRSHPDDPIETWSYSDLLATVLDSEAVQAVLAANVPIAELARPDLYGSAALLDLCPESRKRLSAVFELGRRRAAAEALRRIGITDPKAVIAYLSARLRDEPTEAFLVMALDGRHQVLATPVVSRGTLTQSLAHPREVFRIAIMTRASAIIVAHNHPSGDPTPSGDDEAVTRRLVRAGETLGISVLDHVIIAEGGAYSFRLRRPGVFEVQASAECPPESVRSAPQGPPSRASVERTIVSSSECLTRHGGERMSRTSSRLRPSGRARSDRPSSQGRSSKERLSLAPSPNRALRPKDSEPESGPATLDLLETTWGVLGIVSNPTEVVALFLPEAGAPEVMQRAASYRAVNRASLGRAAGAKPPWLKLLLATLKDYFRGEPVDPAALEVPLATITKGAFLQRVYDELRRVRRGQTLSYAELARKAGSPLASRAVGQAMAQNRHPLLIPCHRVLGSDGKLHGFSAPGGLATKQRLLELEAGG